MRRSKIATFVAGLSGLVVIGMAHAASPEEKCQKARFDAGAKYLSCHQKLLGKDAGGLVDNAKFQASMSKCRLRYQETWAKLQVRLPGTTCDQARFVDNGDGTVTDNLTTLVWEQKDDGGGIHDKDTGYSWGSPNESGSIFSTFLPTLNAAPGFAGSRGWRLPTLAEVQTIVVGVAFACTSPCIDPIFGPTSNFLSLLTVPTSTSKADDPEYFRYVLLENGAVSAAWKPSSGGSGIGARAVRGGL